MDDNYSEIKLLGRGAFGKVVLIKKKNDNKFYALKQIYVKQLTKEELNSYKNEIKILSSFNSQYIVKYYNSFENKEYLNILMEYCGDNLKNFIIKYSKNNESIQEKIIMKIIMQICLGLKEIHKEKVIHRDLKPENIFIDEDYKVKIGDFGVSKMMESYHQYALSLAGTSHYIAPEIEKKEKYDFRVDIYSFGCIIYELFTLSEYYIDKLDEKDCKINLDFYSKEWQNLIELCLQKDFRKRPFIEELTKKLQDLESDINKKILNNELNDFTKLQIIRIKELYEGEISLKKILYSKIEKKEIFVLFDKRWLDTWKSIVGYEILKENYRNLTDLNNNEKIDEIGNIFLKLNTKQKLEDLGKMDPSKLIINYSDKIIFINEKSDFIPILKSQSINFRQIMKICVTFSSLISFGKIIIDNQFSIKNKESKIIILYKSVNIKDYFRMVGNS